MSTIKKLKPQLREDQRMRGNLLRAAPTRNLKTMAKQTAVQQTLGKIHKDPTLTGEQKTEMFQNGAAVLKDLA